jgi:hypothetical protein
MKGRSLARPHKADPAPKSITLQRRNLHLPNQELKNAIEGMMTTFESR